MIEDIIQLFFFFVDTITYLIHQLFIIMGMPLIWICLALFSLLPIPIDITEIELEPYYFWAGFLMFLAFLVFRFEFYNNPNYKFKNNYPEIKERFYNNKWEIKKEEPYQSGGVEPIIIDGIKGLGKTQSAIQMMYDFNSQYPKVLATAKEVEIGKNDSHVIDTFGNKYLMDTKRKLNWHTIFTSPTEKVLVNPPYPKTSLFEKSMDEERKQLSWEESLIYGDTDTEIHQITESTPETYDNQHQKKMYNNKENKKLLEYAPKHPQPSERFYCAIGMEYHNKSNEVYICVECERYVCASCFEAMKEVNATNCPYCQNELVKCK